VLTEKYKNWENHREIKKRKKITQIGGSVLLGRTAEPVIQAGSFIKSASSSTVREKNPTRKWMTPKT